MVSSAETPVQGPPLDRPLPEKSSSGVPEDRMAGAPGTRHIVASAVSAFVVVFLLTGFVSGSLHGAGWASAIGSAASLGTVAAGVQLMLLAVRGRRELEGPGEDEESSPA